LGITILGFLFIVAAVSAQTPTPEWITFYGSNCTVNGAPMPAGAAVIAYDPSGVLCGKFTVVQAGTYGFMPCYLDDPNTPVDEGIRPGDTVQFKIDGMDAARFTVPVSIQNGDRFEVNLVAAPPPVAIPEPSTLILLGGSLAALTGYLGMRRRR